MANFNDLSKEIFDLVLTELHHLEPKYTDLYKKTMESDRSARDSYETITCAIWKAMRNCKQPNFGLTLVHCKRVNQRWRYHIDQLFGGFLSYEQMVIRESKTIATRPSLWKDVNVHNISMKLLFSWFVNNNCAKILYEELEKRCLVTLQLSEPYKTAQRVSLFRIIDLIQTIHLDRRIVKELIDITLLKFTTEGRTDW